MQADGPPIDVVIPVFNGESTIRRAVECVLLQTYTKCSIFVVDDGSTDGTLDALKELDDPRLTVVSRPHAGVSVARNAGLSLGAGEFVAFLDADDECDPRWLEVLGGLAAGAAVVGCAGRIVQDGRPERAKGPTLGEDGRMWPEFLAGLFMVRRDLVEEAGGYDPTMARSENTDLGFRVMHLVTERNLTVTVTDEILVTIRRPRHQSSKYSPEVRRGSAEAMLAKNPRWAVEQPRLAGTYHAIAGHAALRQGDRSSARSHLSQAVRLYPAKGRYWLLLARTWKPFDAPGLWSRMRHGGQRGT